MKKLKRKKVTFAELLKENRKELLTNKKLLEDIEIRIEKRHLKAE